MKILLLLFFACTFLYAQSPDTSWTKTFGGILDDEGYSVFQTSDNGFILSGSYRHQGSDYDAYLVKTNSNGDTLWTKTYGGNESDRGNYVQQTSDGGYIVVGTTVTSGGGISDIYLFKTDANGNLQWEKVYGAFLQDFGNSVQQTTDGGYILTGGFQPPGNTFPDIWLIKTDANGDSVWAKTYGGSSREVGTSVTQTSDGGFIITGQTYSYGAGGSDLWAVRTDANGDTLWTKTFGGADQDEGFSVVQTDDGGFVFAGRKTPSGLILPDAWLLRTDPNGNLLWEKTFGGSNGEMGKSVYQTDDDGFILAGYTDSYGSGGQDAYIVRTDSNGDSLWTKTIGSFGDDEAFSIQQTSDGGYVVAGIFSPLSTIYTDAWLIKIEPDLTNINEIFEGPVSDFQLYQNYPNPFNPSTKISWQSPVGSHQSLKVYDMLGNEVAVLVDDYKPAGSYEIDFDASDLSSGIYFYRLQAGETFVQINKMILLK